MKNSLQQRMIPDFLDPIFRFCPECTRVFQTIYMTGLCPGCTRGQEALKILFKINLLAKLDKLEKELNDL